MGRELENLEVLRRENQSFAPARNASDSAEIAAQIEKAARAFRNCWTCNVLRSFFYYFIC